MKYLIVGLGNIGSEYEHTRHNIGFDILDAFAEASNIVFQTKRYGDVAEMKLKGRTLRRSAKSFRTELRNPSVLPMSMNGCVFTITIQPGL